MEAAEGAARPWGGPADAPASPRSVLRTPSRWSLAAEVRGLAVALAAALVAGCAAMPGTSPADIQLYGDDVEPLIVLPSPMIESPPIEPVEPPLPAPMPMPAPAPAVSAAPVPMSAPPLAPAPVAAASEPPAPSESSAQGTGAPAANVVAAAAPTTLPPVLALPPEDTAALALIADLQRYNGLGPEEVRREIGIATAALTRDRTDANRVRLAVLFTLSHANPQDDQRALQLLDNVAKSGGGPTPVKALAAVLHVQISDRVRTVREEQVKANDAIQKLEALRAMERSLLRDRVRSGGGGGGGAGGGGGGGSGGR